jgi:L-lactate dehydrogenase complex protein LldE
MHVALFLPCLIDQFTPTTGLATARVLRHLGVEVEVPDGQTCCGQPAFNAGYHRAATGLAVRFLERFAHAEAVVTPSGSCASMVRNHYGDLPLPPGARATWKHLRSRVYEFSQFLTDRLGCTDLDGRWSARIAYHASCHLLRELHVDEGPRQLLTSIRELTLVAWPDAELCCGFGGAFAVKFPELSTAMVERKCRSLIALGVDHVVGADPACLLQIGGYLSRQKSSVTPLHLADVLARSLGLL